MKNESFVIAQQAHYNFVSIKTSTNDRSRDIELTQSCMLIACRSFASQFLLLTSRYRHFKSPQDASPEFRKIIYNLVF
jgi:hypothetical protein